MAPPTIPRKDLYRVAADADVHERTVRTYLDGKAVHPRNAAAIARALKARGFANFIHAPRPEAT